jgi:3-hydroxybutyryl-CoA dehydrogenase
MEENPVMGIQTIAVIGAGVMGCDVALDLACHGYEVLLKDIHPDIIQQSEEKIAKGFNLLKMIKGQFKSLSADDILEKIIFTTVFDGFEKADLVIENVTEDWKIKEQVYHELIGICKEETLYAVNTSCFSITRIGALIPWPERVIGVHFLNPVPMKSLVEVIRGYHTSDETVTAIKAFLKSLDKSAVVVNDAPGFVTNRVLMLTINEAIWVVHDKTAEPQQVDKIFTLGFGHQTGPLATADLIGLDTILNSLKVLCESYKDPKYRPCPLLVKMVDAGLLGRKSGKGFFEYPGLFSS